jgi:aspartyl-tRNA(Asn)/glutamyl-tRNA(Gln) amidotransferase subunit C
MSVSRDEVKKIASLAKLRLSEQELDTFAQQFQRILGYVEKLKEIDVSGIPPTSHISLGDWAQRSGCQDKVCQSLDQEDALGGAPDAGSGHFKVPRMI